MKRLLLIAAALVAFTNAGNAQGPHGPYQSCRGVLTEDAFGDYYLKVDPPDSLCYADIQVRFVGADAINRILAVCKIDGRCHIKGRISGGRRIVWTSIVEVTRP
jgi:hypothetical protein